jgi:hypothetical protein
MLFFPMHLHHFFNHFHINLRNYFLMVSNARIYLSLQVTACNCIIKFIFLKCDMMLSDIQYGRVYLFDLTTCHGDQCGNQRRKTAECAQCQQ